ncbi:Kelch-type beta propeller [Arabidopsis suecica]|uniref:Kelch-type beta propeller n=1 Tax=Arabidopsis suecica TaxID=45249 RepID=A0A8T1XY76_ARASU|nr:Kelch-type beta propeller [Arabidopsis suecica]
MYIKPHKLFKNETQHDPFRNTIEVFDTRTQVWDPDPIPCSVAKEDMPFYNSACIDGKFHVVAGSKVVAYDAKEGRWDLVGPDMSSYMFSDSHCEVDNVLYSVSHGVFIWYDTELRSWRDLKGLVGLPKFPPEACVRLADYGGKLAVFWFEIFRYGLGYKNKIWCAEIELERRFLLRLSDEAGRRGLKKPFEMEESPADYSTVL